jgi:hypothetical protein
MNPDAPFILQRTFAVKRTMMKKKKGTYGYYRNNRIVMTVLSAALLGGDLAMFFVSRNYFGTTKNLFTIFAVLVCLPIAMAIVNAFMNFRARGCSEEAHRKISEHEGKLSCLYDLYLTSYRENYALSHMAVYATTFVAYTEDPKCLTKNGEAHIRTMMANNGHKGIDVKIFTDINKYVNRLDAMNRQLDEGGAKDETEILELMKQIAL